MSDEARWFPSKVDTWLAVFMALPPIGAIVALVDTIGGDDRWIGLLAVVLTVGLYGGLVFPMRYGITATELVVRHGLVRGRYPLADIQSVRPTRNPLSSPALSLDRLEVVKGSGLFGSILISPADKEGFLALLAGRSGLVRKGDSLERAPTPVATQ